MKITTLYVKTHTVTGLKYFGKTTYKDVVAYTGSGKYWNRHIKKHGYLVSTEIIGVFDDPIWIQLYALEFSALNDIVNSALWANCKNENGLDGGWSHINDDETFRKAKNSKAGKACHIKHPGLRFKNLKKMTSETASKIVNVCKERYGADHYKKIASVPCSVAKKEKLRTASLNNNSGKSNTGKIRIKIKCPHCDKHGASNTMLRWHFENCKNKISQ